MLSVILASMMIILLSTLSMIRYLICDNWNLLLKLNLIYVDWDGKWLVDLIVGKTQLVSFDWSNNTEAIVWIWMALFYRKNNLLRCWAWFSLPNWIGDLTLSILLKLFPMKLEHWFVSENFFLLRLQCISIKLPYSHAWNIVVMSS